MKRAEFGLPEDATVFCVNCINAHHKIDPTVFAAWMEILRQVPDSILWISDGAKTMRDNLQQAAASYNIAPERLVFVPKLPLPEYLARLALADLALDTFLYTGGSSSVTTLWAGLPLLTRVGETNASRMGASICAAAGLEQLTCDNTETYIKRAVELVNQKQELATIRTILQKQRKQLPLFDMKNFAQHLEAAYQKIWDLHE
jgi:predicted O-linked N-acetylglucosamine transferase (SPINDLY family)